MTQDMHLLRGAGTEHAEHLAIGWWWGGYSPDKWLDRRASLPPGVDLLRLGITVGQGVGALREIQPAAKVLAQLMRELDEALVGMPRPRSSSSSSSSKL